MFTIVPPRQPLGAEHLCRDLVGPDRQEDEAQHPLEPEGVDVIESNQAQTGAEKDRPKKEANKLIVGGRESARASAVLPRTPCRPLPFPYLPVNLPPYQGALHSHGSKAPDGKIVNRFRNRGGAHAGKVLVRITD